MVWPYTLLGTQGLVAIQMKFWVQKTKWCTLFAFTAPLFCTFKTGAHKRFDVDGNKQGRFYHCCLIFYYYHYGYQYMVSGRENEVLEEKVVFHS